MKPIKFQFDALSANVGSSVTGAWSSQLRVEVTLGAHQVESLFCRLCEALGPEVTVQLLSDEERQLVSENVCS